MAEFKGVEVCIENIERIKDCIDIEFATSIINYTQYNFLKIGKAEAEIIAGLLYNRGRREDEEGVQAGKFANCMLVELGHGVQPLAKEDRHGFFGYVINYDDDLITLELDNAGLSLIMKTLGACDMLVNKNEQFIVPSEIGKEIYKQYIVSQEKFREESKK